jgi:hypothetical protein
MSPPSARRSPAGARIPPPSVALPPPRRVVAAAPRRRSSSPVRAVLLRRRAAAAAVAPWPASSSSSDEQQRLRGPCPLPPPTSSSSSRGRTRHSLDLGHPDAPLVLADLAPNPATSPCTASSPSSSTRRTTLSSSSSSSAGSNGKRGLLPCVATGLGSRGWGRGRAPVGMGEREGRCRNGGDVGGSAGEVNRTETSIFWGKVRDGGHCWRWP